MEIFKNMASKDLLLSWYATEGNNLKLNVNNHIHSPYSFSAFTGINQAVELAKEQEIKILGLNDFFVFDGYDEFYKECSQANILPLFNVEFIGLLKQEQANGIRVNDPNNPGRTYFSGKGIKYPVQLSAKNDLFLQGLIIESLKQIVDMVDKLNKHLESISAPFRTDYYEVKKNYARNLVRERHLAKALRIELQKHFKIEEDQKAFLQKLYGGKESKANLNDPAALENEIRGMMLKAGGVAFVPEKEEAFPEISRVIQFMLDAGGVPTYPVLLDDAKGNLTEFEADKKKLKQRLQELNVYSIELIPNRNSIKHLKPFVEYFYKEGFLVTFGTEHNTPELSTLKITTREGSEIPRELKEINFESSSILLAHQYLMAKGDQGFVNSNGTTRINEREEFLTLGKAVADKFLRED